jgi:hypothetical protein
VDAHENLYHHHHHQQQQQAGTSVGAIQVTFFSHHGFFHLRDVTNVQHYHSQEEIQRIMADSSFYQEYADYLNDPFVYDVPNVLSFVVDAAFVTQTVFSVDY